MPGRAVVAYRNAQLETSNTYIGSSGQFRLYTGSRNSTLGSLPAGTLLATVNLGASPFGTAANGETILTGLPRTTTAVAGGDIGCAVLLDSAGNAMADWNQGDGLTVLPVTVVTGQQINLSGLALSVSNPV